MNTKKQKIITIISTIVLLLAYLSLILVMGLTLNVIAFLFFIIICMIITALVAFFVPTYKSRTIAITFFIATLAANLYYIETIKSFISLADSSKSLADSGSLLGLLLYMVFSFVGTFALPERIIPYTLGMAITALVAFFIPSYKSEKFRIMKIVIIALFIATSLICLLDMSIHYLSVRNVLHR